MYQITFVQLGGEDCQIEIAPSKFFSSKNNNMLYFAVQWINLGQKTDRG